MSRYLPYSPEQGYLVPPRVDEVLSADHLCFFVHKSVEKLDLSRFDQSYGQMGGRLYDPSLMLKVWLYAYLLGVTSSRRLEQRIREDLAFRFLAGAATPDYWALNAFRSRHGKAINDCFTQVVEMARSLKLAQLGTVAIDATRIKASASPDKVIALERQQRAKTRRNVRRWQQSCDGDDPNEGAGGRVGTAIDAIQDTAATLKPLPRRAKRPSEKRSITDPDARFLRSRGNRFVLGYSGEIAVSEDHLIVAQRVTQSGNENDGLEPMVKLVNETCGELPQRVLADSGYYSNENVERMEALTVDAYVPDSNLARELNTRNPATDLAGHDPRLKRMRHKLRDPDGRAMYSKRRGIVEPVFGIMKEQRNFRSFRLRSTAKVQIEFALAATAYNLKRIYLLTKAR
jgi:transposase